MEHLGGVELPLALAVATLAFGFTGPGRFSLDHLAGWSLAGATWVLVAAAIMLAGPLFAGATRRLAIQQRSGTTASQTA